MVFEIVLKLISGHCEIDRVWLLQSTRPNKGFLALAPPDFVPSASPVIHYGKIKGYYIKPLWASCVLLRNPCVIVENPKKFTQYGFIRNTVKYQLVLFLIFQLFPIS